MAGNVKGITITFAGDTTSLDKALRKVRTESKEVDKELSAINRALKFNPKNTELLAQKQAVLKQRIETTEKSLKDLKQVQAQMDADPSVDNQSEEYRRLQREIIETESKLKHFEAEAKKLEHIKLTNLGKSLDEAGKKAETAGKSLTKYITVPLTAAGAASVKAGMDFDSAMSQVAATMGTTTDDIKDLRDYAIKMGSSTSFSATEAAEALNYMALAGYDADTSMKMLPTVLNLAAAGGMDLATASDAVTDAQSALGLSTDETTTLIDQMAKASSKTNTSVEQLSTAILTVGGTARTMKGGTEELTAVLGVLADNGIKGSEGGTALRNILLSLQSPTDKAAKTLKEMGVSVYDSEGNMRSMTDILADMNGALSDMTGEERAKALSSVFNKRDLKSVNALLNTSTDRWEELGLALDDAGGAAEKMAATQLDNLKGSLTLLKSALEGAAIAVSDVISPVIRKFADKVSKWVDKFNKLSPAMQKRIVAIGVAIAAIGPVLTVVGKGMQLVGKVMQNVTTIVGGLSKAISFLAANPIVLIIAGIAALVAAFVILWKKSEAFRNFFIGMWNKIKTTVTAIMTAIKTYVSTTWAAITTIFKTALSAIKTAWSGISSYFAGKWAAIKAVFTGAKAWFGNLFAGVFSAIKAKFAGWGSFWSGLWTSIKNKFKSIGTSIANAIGNSIRSGINGVISMIQNTINSGINLINGAIGLINKLPGVEIGKIGQLSLPRLAKGGVLNGAQTVIAGEAGPEAIIPLDKLFAQMDKMADRMAESNAPAGNPVNIYINAPDSKTAREIAQEVKRIMIAEVKGRRTAWA